MSTTVDTRVVEMKFDNQRFKDNIQETIDLLQQLDESLELEDGAKGFKAISKAAEQVDLDPITGSIEKVKVSFNAMQIAAITAITNITNKAIAAGEKLVKSLSVDNIAAGWSKFEQTTTSVGTLISQGFSMEEVTEQLDKLNWFTDETSYNFTEMVNNIGKFTATGKGLTESVQAMMGIANWAALSGQNAQKATSAMYQLSQAMGKGALKYDDWKSIQNAGMDTIEFRKNAAEAAVELGVLKKSADGLYKTLKGKTFTLQELFSSDNMSKQAWFTDKVMMQVFEKYSSAVDGIYEKIGTLDEETGKTIDTASEAMSKFGNELDEFGMKAFRAAQEARTWTDVIDSVKDAVSSKWKDTFQYIIGDYQEAKQLFTGLANLLYDVFASSGNDRNDILAIWKENGGRTDLLNALAAGFYNLTDIINQFKDAWNNVFYNGMNDEEIIQAKADRLNAITKAFRNFMYHFKLNETSLRNLRDFLTGIFSVVKTVREGLFNILTAISPAFASFGSITNVILAVAGALGRFLSKVTETARESGVLTKVAQGIAASLKVVESVIIIIIALIVKAIPYVKTFVQMLGSGILLIGGTVVSGIVSGIGLIIGAVVKAYSAIKDFVGIIKMGFTAPMTMVNSVIENTNNGLLKFIFSITRGLRIVAQFFASVVGKVAGFIKKIGDFFQSFKGLSFKEIIDKLVGKIVAAKDKIVEIFTKPNEEGKTLAGTIKNVTEQFVELFRKIDVGTVVALAFTASMVGVAGALAKLLSNASGLIGNASGFISTLKKVITKTYSKSVGILNIAEAFGILAASIYLLSRADKTSLNNAVIAILEICGILTATYGLVLLLNKFLAKGTGGDAKGGILGSYIGSTLIGLAASILSVAVSLKMIQDIQFNGNLVKNLLTVLTAVGIMSAITVAMNRLMFKSTKNESIMTSIVTRGKRTTNKTLGSVEALTQSFAPTSLLQAIAPIITISALASSLKKIVEALKGMEQLDPNLTLNNVLALTPILVAFGILAMGVGQIRLSTAVGLLMVLKIVEMIIPNLAEITAGLNAMPALVNESTLITITSVVMGALAIITLLFAIRGKQISEAGKALRSMTVAIMALLAFVVYLSTQNFTIDGSIVATLVVIGAILAGLMTLSQFTANNKMVKFSVGMLILTGVIAILINLMKKMKELRGENETWIDTMLDFAPLYALLALVAVIEGMSALTGKSKIFSLIVIFGGIFSLLTAIIALSVLDIPKILVVCGSLAAVFITLARVFARMSQVNLFSGGGALMALGGMALVITTFGEAVTKIITSTPTDIWYAAPAVIGAIGVVVWILGGVLKKLETVFNNGLFVGGGALMTLVGFSATIVSLGIAVSAIVHSTPTEVWYSAPAIIGSIAVVVGVLGKVLAAILKINNAGALKTGGAAAIALVGFSATILALGNAVTAIVRNTPKEVWYSAPVAIGAIGLVVSALGGVLIGILNINNGNIISTAIASVIEMVAFCGVIWLVGDALSKAAMYDWKNLLAVAGAIDLVLAAVAGISMLFGATSAFSVAGVGIFALALGALVLAMIGAAGAFNIFADSLVKLKDAAKDNPIQTLSEQIQQAVETLNTNQGYYYKVFYDLGTQIVAGYTNGILANEAKAIDMGRLLALCTEYGLIKEAIIKSPSHKMYQLGAFMCAGYGLGIASGEHALEEQGKELVTIIDEPVAAASELVQDRSAEMVTGVGAIMTGGVDTLTQTFAEGSDDISDTMDDLGDDLVKSQEETYSTMEENTENTIANQLDALSSVDKFVTNNGILSTLSEWGSGIAGVGAGIVGTAGEMVGFLDAGTAEAWSNWWFNSGKKTKELHKEANRQKVTEQIGSYLGIEMEAGDTIISALTKKMTNLFEKFKKNLSEKLPELKEWATTFLKNSLGIDINGILGGLTGEGGSIEDYYNKFLSDLGVGGEGGNSFLNDIFNTDTLANWSDSMAAASAVTEDATDVYSKLYQTLAQTTDAFSELSIEATKTPKQMMQAMQSQIVGTSQWANNITRLAAKGLNYDLLNELSQKGTAGFAEVAAYARMTADEIAEVNAMYNALQFVPADASWQVSKALQYAAETALTGSSAALDTYQDVANSAAEGLENFDSALGSAGETAEEYTSVFETLTDKFKDLSLATADFNEESYKTNVSMEDLLRNSGNYIAETAEMADNIVRIARKGLNLTSLKDLVEQGDASKIRAFAYATQEQIDIYNKQQKKLLQVTSTVPTEITKAYQYAGEMAVNGFSNALDDYSDVIDYDPLTEGLDEVADAAEEAAEKVKSVFETVGESLNQLDPFSEFSLKAEKSFDDLMESLKTNIFGVSEWSNNITRLAARGLNTQIIQELVEKGAQGSFQEVNALVAATDEQIEQYNNLWEIMQQQTPTAALQVTKSLEYSAEKALKGASQALDDYAAIATSKPIFNEMWKKAQEEALQSAVIDSLYEHLNADENGELREESVSREDLTDLADDLILKLKTNYESLNDITETEKYLVSEYGMAADEAQEIVSLGRNAINNFNDSDVSVKIGEEVITDIQTGMEEQIPSVHQLVKDTGLETADFYAEAFGDNMETFLTTLYPELIQPEVEEITEHVTLDWENAGHGSSDAYDMAFTENITSFLEQLWPQVMQPASDDIKDQMLASWREYGNASVNAHVGEFTEGMEQFLANLYPETMDPAITGIDQSLITKWNEVGKNAADATVKGYTDGLNANKDTVDAAITKTFSTGASLTAAAQTSGSNAASGLVQGFKAKIDTTQVKDVIRTSAGTVIEVTRETLKEHSPSKVMMQIGKYAAEGLAIGIENGTSDIESSANTMAGVIQTVVDNALDYLNTDDDNSIVLTPILDLSKIQNGAGELDSYFGTRQVDIATSKFNENAAAKRAAQMDMTASRIEAAIGRYSDAVVAAITNSEVPVEVNVTLQGDSAKLFNMIRKENSKFTKVNGYNALA
ncbi:MAG: tape measure protein [Pseudobutyrivibrio sp.]|nr:tape measure protein [Pseudobutyrivibrio sp.]